MRLQPLEVFEASTECLREELRHLEANAVNATAQEAPELLRLRTLIQQELEERGGAEELFDGLQELEDFLGSAAAFIDGLDAEDDVLAGPQPDDVTVQQDDVAGSPSSVHSAGPSVSSHDQMPDPFREDAEQPQCPVGAAASCTAQSPLASQQHHTSRIHIDSEAVVKQTGTGAWGGGGNSPATGSEAPEMASPVAPAAAEAADDGGDPGDGEGGTSTKEGEEGEPSAPKKILTPYEAAMLAYKEEKRRVAKAKRAREAEGWGFQAKPKPRREPRPEGGSLPWVRKAAVPRFRAKDTNGQEATRPHPAAAEASQELPSLPRRSSIDDTSDTRESAPRRSILSKLEGHRQPLAASQVTGQRAVSATARPESARSSRSAASAPGGVTPKPTERAEAVQSAEDVDGPVPAVSAWAEGSRELSPTGDGPLAGGLDGPTGRSRPSPAPPREHIDQVVIRTSPDEAPELSAPASEPARDAGSLGQGIDEGWGGGPDDGEDALSYVDPSEDGDVDDVDDVSDTDDYDDRGGSSDYSLGDAVGSDDGAGSGGGSWAGSIGFVSDDDGGRGAGGPTRLVVRPDSADSTRDREGGLVAALADFGLGGNANGGLCAWGDAEADGLDAGDGWGAGADDWLLDSPRQQQAEQSKALGYDARPGAPMVGPLSAHPQGATSDSESPEKVSSARPPPGRSTTDGPGTRAGSAMRNRPAALPPDSAPSPQQSYHYTYTSFPEIFTEFSTGREQAMQAEAARADGALADLCVADRTVGHSSGRPSSGRPTTARHDSGAVWDRMARTSERCCRWLEHHQELWPEKGELSRGIARSRAHPVTRWYRVACTAGHPEVFNVVSAAMELAGGWDEDVVDGPAAASKRAPVHSSGKSFMWNLMWTWSAKVPVPYSDLMVWQKVNHFPDARQLTRKDLLKRHLSRHHKMLKGTRAASIFNVMPPTFNLPKEYSLWVEAFGKGVVEAKDEGDNLWIMKPVGSSRGRGISVVSKVDDILHGEQVVVQKYISRPLLVDGYKFDLRLYVLVTSFNPLEAWLYREGFSRFATTPYTTDPSQLDNLYVHLTNSSIQKQRGDDGGLPPRLVGGPTTGRAFGGSKCTLSHLWELLEEQGVERSRIWSRITNVVLAALFAVQSSIPHNVNSFELYGFDVIISKSQKVWLIEANSSPSLGCDSPLDREVKPVLVRDIIGVVEPPVFDRVALAEVLARRLSKRGRSRGDSRLMSGTDQVERELLNEDLSAVLGGRMPREYGVMPKDVGQFDRIAPSRAYEEIQRMKTNPRG